MGHYAQKKTLRPSEQTREDVAAARLAFAELQPVLDAARLVFVDESGFVRGGRLGYGWSARGARGQDRAPLARGRRRSMIGSMAHRCGEVVAVAGTVTADVFERFVARDLVPSLEAGDVVVWDNARVHSAQARRLVEQAGCHVVALPCYSPEYNAIEHLWSKVKQSVRRARADTDEALSAALAAAVSAVCEHDARGWIKHCGYRFQPQ